MQFLTVGAIDSAVEVSEQALHAVFHLTFWFQADYLIKSIIEWLYGFRDKKMRELALKVRRKLGLTWLKVKK